MPTTTPEPVQPRPHLGVRAPRGGRAAARHRAPGLRGAGADPADDRVRLRNLAGRRPCAVCGAGFRRHSGQPPLCGQLSAARTTSTRRHHYPSYSELDRRLRNGELRFALEIPPASRSDLQRGRQPDGERLLDAAVPFRAETARGYVESVTTSTETQLRDAQGPAADAASR